MLRIGLGLVLLFGAALPQANAQEQGRALNPQQQRMRDCNAQADLKAPKGSRRKDFMRACLSSGRVEVHFGEVAEGAMPELPPASPEPAPTQAETEKAARRAAWKQKLGPCIGEAQRQELKGEARKNFMSECLKPSPEAAE